MRSSEAGGPRRAARASRTTRFLANAGRAAASIALALIVGEAGLRVAGIKFTESLYTNDPSIGWSLRPSSEGWSVDERTIYVRVNSAGMHDREHAIAKPPGTLRIAVLGDSMTASIEVAAEDTSSAAMELAFTQCTAARPRQVEVLNFGVPGFNMAQMLLLLRHRVWQYSPDIVLLELFSGNNLMNNRRDLNNADATLAPYYVLRNGKLELDDSYRSLPAMHPANIRRHNQIAGIMNAIRLLQLVRYAELAAAALLRGEKADARAARFGADYQLRLVYKPPAAPEIENAWALAEALIVAMRDEVGTHSAQFWLATSYMPSWESQRSKAQEALYGRYGPESLLYPDWRFVSLARRERIPAVVLSDYLQNYAGRRHATLNGWPEGHLGAGHWNELGQRIVGEYLAQQFCPLLGRTEPMPEILRPPP